MIRVWLAFLFVFGLFFFGIDMFRKMTGRERLDIIKTLTYSFGCAILTFITLALIVIVF